MPKVLMRTGGANPAGLTWQPGQVVELSDESAEATIAGGYGTRVKAPAVEEDIEEVALMALTNDELLELAVENGITGLASRPTKAELVAALRDAGVMAPQLETAELEGGEVAAVTDAPPPRERVPSATMETLSEEAPSDDAAE